MSDEILSQLNLEECPASLVVEVICLLAQTQNVVRPRRVRQRYSGSLAVTSHTDRHSMEDRSSHRKNYNEGLLEIRPTAGASEPDSSTRPTEIGGDSAVQTFQKSVRQSARLCGAVIVQCVLA